MISDEAWKALTIIVPSMAVVVGRLLSNREHRKTEKQVNDIYILINGETKKKIQDAYERGVKDTEEKNK